MTTRKKKVFSDIESLEQGLTDETLEESFSLLSEEIFSETPVEKEEEPEPVAKVKEITEEVKAEVIEEEPKRQPVQVGPRPAAPAKRIPSKNTPKFSAKLR